MVYEAKIDELHGNNTAVFATAMLARYGFDASNKKLIADANATEAKLETVTEAAVEQPCCSPQAPEMLVMVIPHLSD